MLKEEFDDETGNAGNSQATEGQAGQATESGSTENGVIMTTFKMMRNFCNGI